MSTKHFLIINGPNLNMLGIREPEVYGSGTYDELCALIKEHAVAIGVRVSFYQSNHEGDLVDVIQKSRGNADGIVINAGAYTHTSVALLDALRAAGTPAVEVHISDLNERAEAEPFRAVSYLRAACIGTVMGHGFRGYCEALDMLASAVGPSETV